MQSRQDRRYPAIAVPFLLIVATGFGWIVFRIATNRRDDQADRRRLTVDIVKSTFAAAMVVVVGLLYCDCI